jgi:hypothetical protein
MASFTNKWNNSEFTGAVVGAPGTAPTNWTRPSTGGGVTITNEVVSFGTVSGRTQIGIKLTVANSTGAAAYVNVLLGEITGISASTLHQISLWMRKFNETGSTYFNWLACFEWNSGGGYVNNITSLANPGGTMTQYDNSFTTNGSTGRLTPYLGVGVPPSSNYSCELEIANGMLVQGSTLPPGYIPTVDATNVTYNFNPTPPRPGRAFLPLLLR